MAKYCFLTPTFKVKFLQLAIDSMLKQSFDDFEIIISDDSSPYHVADVIKNYNDHRIRFRRNISNFGGKNLVDHWNLLLKESNAEYVIVASDDDVYQPNFLEDINSLSLKYPYINVLRARVQRIDENGEITSKEDIFEEYQTQLEALYSIFCGNYIGCVGNYVFRRSALLKIGGFINFPYAWFSDLVTAMNLIQYGQANTKAILFNFRISNYNISNTKHNKEVDRHKLRATILFDEWVSMYMKAINTTQLTSLERYQYNNILAAYKHRAYTQAGDYSWTIPFWKWWSIYKSFRTHPFFSKMSFIKYFCISILNRKGSILLRN
ncbi:putative glycosyltransferase [Prevotella intermedia]|uniref:Glycosyltransferase n=1 Tax=Prevotella intermedia TaxID=28131 RepID=A0AAD1BGB8_PREIN|nr:glycosyltransferase family 2 protein [Prevotella intermedia]AFJ08639.1 glycosyltransferase, group 2 family protein [Prevotella intermedia 17]APW34458.1 hypothetical protein BWX40_06190 [Prevotella intermedia]BAR95862.1 putative glycosyltransferase [Prevotella intermedia]